MTYGQLGFDAALAAFGLDKVAGVKQLMRAYEATRRMDPRMATPGGLEAQKAFNAMAKSVGGHRHMPRALGEMGHPEGMTLPLQKGERVSGSENSFKAVNQLFSRSRQSDGLRPNMPRMPRMPPRELAQLRKELREGIAKDPYQWAAELQAQQFPLGGERAPKSRFAKSRVDPTPEEHSRSVAELAEMYKASVPEMRAALSATYAGSRKSPVDPRDMRELLSGRHIPKGVDREKAVLVRPEELPHEPYSVQWKGGIPLPRNTPPNTAVWATGYPTIAGGYATKKMREGDSRLRAYPIDSNSARYTPHVAQDVRKLPDEELQKLTQRAGRSASGALPHYERVTSHRDLGSPVAVFKPVGDGRFQQVLGAPMPRVGSGIGDL